MKWSLTHNSFLERLDRFKPAANHDSYLPVRILALAVVYFIVARFGFTFAPGKQVTALWPAAGVSLASLLLFGYRVWPGILLGSFLSKMSVHLPIPVGLSIAIANTLEPLIAVWLLRRFMGADHYLERLKGVMCLWLFSILSTLVGALIGATTIWLSGLQPETPYSTLFLTWWLGDAGGSLIVTPLLLAWGRGKYSIPSLKTTSEAFALFAITAAGCIAIFFHPSVLGSLWVYPYMVFPLVIWAAISFRQRGVTLMVLCVAHISLSSALFPTGPFAAMAVELGVIIAQMYVMIVTMIGLTVSAALSERNAAEKQIQKSWEYLQNVIDHIPDPLLMKDRQHLLLGGNKALWAILNRTPEALIGHSCDDIFLKKDEVQAFNERYDKVFNTGETDISEEVFTDHTGKQHILSVKTALLQSGEDEPSLVVIAHDITPLKETEERLLKYTRDLEVSNRELDDFVYIASHDLKEPLRGMQNFSHFLLEDCADKLDEQGKKKLQAISDLAVRLDTLLDVLLRYSRLGRTAMAIGLVNLEELIRSSLGIFAISLQEKNVTVEIGQKWPAIECDGVRIGEVFQNLIGNALKYNDNKENKIEIGCMTDHPQMPGENVFYVRDHGIGIPPEFHQAIFKIFKRLHPRGAYSGGTGSGLAIVKKIISQHHGKVWVESAGTGQGSTFCFTVPQKKKQM